ncbi:SDR family oxidoreductase [Stakelama tenebrarum]|uniref:SDR family oxidoreductase n=1 Tax=Stakelama tenebrarum TaxID=2711215 RepID=A0A6G6Y845_9SPHN|nr:SDR family oxidoreductase [Sphingosinithalassobacter tenebrarum]QIG80746.1 SDR family oxidoreductase [Sphingosinithalassobacter tenebrarum]
MSKKIVITGAGIGLGRALARRFVADGHKVVLLGRTFSKLKTLADELGDAALPVECDVAVPESVRNAFAKIAETHPTIDVLINNAAVFVPFEITEATDDQILQAVTINLGGTMLCTRSAVPMMEAGGQIINLSSESVDMNFPMLSVYQSTKAGIERFSKSMDQELEPLGIRVSTVRAGQMFDEDKTFDLAPEVAMKFAQKAMAAGVNLRERPITHFRSVTDAFAALIDLPGDLHAGLMTLHAHRAPQKD